MDANEALQKALEAMRNKEGNAVLGMTNQPGVPAAEAPVAGMGEVNTFSPAPKTAEPTPVVDQSKFTDNHNNSSTLTIPKIRPFLVTATTQQMLGGVDRLTATGRNVNILLTGPHGTGKSELPSQYAATRNRPFAQIDCGGLTEAFQLFGRMNLRNGETVYQRGLFLEAINTPNAVIHLQELNRAESDRALNALFSILDDTSRALWIEELGEYAAVAPGVTFFASLNEGYQYIGTMPLDEALRNRFLFKIAMRPLTRQHEESLLRSRFGLSSDKAKPLHDLVERVRNQNRDSYISTRDLVAMGELVSVGFTPAMALRAVLGTDDDILEGILLSEHFQGQETVASNRDDFELLR